MQATPHHPMPDIAAWAGRSETVHDTITPTPVMALTATLDHAVEPVLAGTPLPPLWHWLYFLPLHRQSELGTDGHARRGGLPAAGAVAAPHVGRQPVRVSRARARGR
jgi:3-methylfumaryl-CoA hydratase